MPPKRLDEALGGVVEDCVNSVGVDINTASPSLLQRVAGRQLLYTGLLNAVVQTGQIPGGDIAQVMACQLQQLFRR